MESRISYLGEGRARIESAGRSLVVNQRLDIGLPGAGFCPMELISASLGACMLLTTAAVAADKGIEASGLGVRVTAEVVQDSRQSRATFRSQIHLGEGLTERERRILFNSARRCEVHKLLAGEAEFSEELCG
jgi:uncharacterized OsmC-like protein